MPEARKVEKQPNIMNGDTLELECRIFVYLDRPKIRGGKLAEGEDGGMDFPSLTISEGVRRVKDFRGGFAPTIEV